MAKPETKTVTRKVSIPKTKILKQREPQSATSWTPNDTERADMQPIRPQPPLANQQP